MTGLYFFQRSFSGADPRTTLTQVGLPKTRPHALQSTGMFRMPTVVAAHARVLQHPRIVSEARCQPLGTPAKA